MYTCNFHLYRATLLLCFSRQTQAFTYRDTLFHLQNRREGKAHSYTLVLITLWPGQCIEVLFSRLLPLNACCTIFDISSLLLSPFLCYSCARTNLFETAIELNADAKANETTYEGRGLFLPHFLFPSLFTSLFLSPHQFLIASLFLPTMSLSSLLFALITLSHSLLLLALLSSWPLLCRSSPLHAFNPLAHLKGNFVLFPSTSSIVGWQDASWRSYFIHRRS